MKPIQPFQHDFAVPYYPEKKFCINISAAIRFSSILNTNFNLVLHSLLYSESHDSHLDFV